MRLGKTVAVAVLGISALALSACDTALHTEVSRYQAMPAPQGQTFVIVPGEGRARPGGLEFERYAALVAQQLGARGYRPASDMKSANMVVHLGYNIDSGQTRIVDYGPAWGGPLYRARFGYWGSPFFYGWNDPWFGGGIDSYVEFHSEVDVHIRAAGTNQPLFDGRAEARSGTNRLDALLPGLIEALFTGFPGQSGEVVKITIPANPPQPAHS